ncbi:imidazolonepropionase [Thermonema rossianum]|uniref:imidazolonepropionase n=1 Tax=Thermonema rossianum TaxID=55505 RepID=UPI00056DB100|nr:imidazolonepropionase [Thermonema rossianum]
MKIIGPFEQLLTMENMPLRGPVKDEHCPVWENAGILTDNGRIVRVDAFDTLLREYPAARVEFIEEPAVAVPGLVDAHTHICFAGSRAMDYCMRMAGKTYEEIARAGGGILSSVRFTRAASGQVLMEGIEERLRFLNSIGITTCEIKSGYALDKEGELKMLRAIKAVQRRTPAHIVPTFLGAHTCPPEFQDQKAYLQFLLEEVLPVVKEEGLSGRVDIFVEDIAFSVEEARFYLLQAAAEGFALTVHADQFTAGGARLAVELKAQSADHLEASAEEDIAALAASDTAAVVLPGASLGLGIRFAPTRRLLDAGCVVAIASDWNPGSAPMGDLLVQAALLGIYEKLSAAELWAGLTYRAAYALGLEQEVGCLQKGFWCDLAAFPTNDHREVWYAQGRMKPWGVWARAERLV